MKQANLRERGSSLLEFTLVGIGIIFLLISIFEASRGMWNYHTMAYAIREGTRFAVVHGFNCESDPLNSCRVTIGRVAQQIKDAGVGLDPAQLTLNFTSGGIATTCALSDCMTKAPFTTTVWPAAPYNIPGMPLSISGTIPFRSAITLFWPGAGSGFTFKAFTFPGSSQDLIQF